MPSTAVHAQDARLVLYALLITPVKWQRDASQGLACVVESCTMQRIKSDTAKIVTVVTVPRPLHQQQARHQPQSRCHR
jgi:hypothetical protein